EGPQAGERRQHFPLEGGGLGGHASLPVSGGGLAGLRALGAVELFEQVEQLRGNALVLHRTVKGAQARTDIRVRAQPVLVPARLRPRATLGQLIVSRHYVEPTEFRNVCRLEIEECSRDKKVPSPRNFSTPVAFCASV